MSKPEASRENWFQKNPKKTLVFFTLFLLLLLTAGAEKFLELVNHRNGIFLETERRYIRLREYRPLSQMMISFPRGHLPFTDNVFTKKYPLRVDADGFIIPSRVYSSPDLSLVFLGGSTTECMFVDEDNRFPYLVGVLLTQETGKKINSYNGGMSGNNSLHAIDLLVNKVMPLKPRAVVFMENINELSTLVYEGTYWNHNNSRAPLETLKKVKLVGKLLKEICIPNLNYAYRNLKQTLFAGDEDEFAGARHRKLRLDQKRLVQEYEMNLQAIVDLCRVRGIVPVLMTQGNRITNSPDPVVKAYVGQYSAETGITYARFKEIYDAFNETVRRVGRRNRVLVIDLAAAVPPSKEYFYDMLHFNDAGSCYAARVIATQLKPVVEEK